MSEGLTAAGAADSGPRLSTLFCDDAAEITFKSSDNVLFKIYRVHLASNSRGFEVPESTIVNAGPVELEEPESVLEILFQFIHPCLESNQYRQPSVMTMDFSLFFSVAEAAEKYIVSGAMNTCITRMHQLISTHPIEILNHCDRHDYYDLSDAVAPEILTRSFQDIASGLSHPGLLARWV